MEFWSFDDVEQRLIEAWISLRRLPDREQGWLRTSTMGLWRQVQSEEAEADPYELPPRPGLTRAEVREMEEALGWLEGVEPTDRKLIGLAVGRLARGDARVPWRRLLRAMGLRHGADGLRKRYGRAIKAICALLNARQNQDYLCQPLECAAE